MAEEILEQTLGTPEARAISSVPGGGDDGSPTESGDSSLSRSLSSSRLNAQAAEFVPRSTQLPSPSSVPIRHGHAPAAHPVMHVFHQAPPSPTYFTPSSSSFEYYGAAQPGGFKDHEGGHTSADSERTPQERDGISEEVIQKITKQVWLTLPQALMSSYVWFPYRYWVHVWCTRIDISRNIHGVSLVLSVNLGDNPFELLECY